MHSHYPILSANAIYIVVPLISKVNFPYFTGNTNNLDDFISMKRGSGQGVVLNDIELLDKFCKNL